ncbi:putative tetratricopeptide-like helical domain superfamily [Arabidopsis thaliana]
MEFSTADFERLIMFEHARKNSEAQYKNDPLDSEVSFFYLSSPLLRICEIASFRLI